MEKIIIVGVGNILFKDEGVGVYAANYIEENFSFAPQIEIIDGATLGFRLMSYFQEYENVLILDTISIKDAPGSIYRLPHEEMLGLGSYRQSAHEVEVVEMLEICSLLEQIATVTVFGIVPADITSVEIGLTQELHGAFENYINAIMDDIKTLGVEVSKKEHGKSLEDVIRSKQEIRLEERI